MMMITMMIILRSRILTEFHEVSRCLRYLLLNVVFSECSKLIFLHIICLYLDQNHTACLFNIHPYQLQEKSSPPMAGCLRFSIWYYQPQHLSLQHAWWCSAAAAKSLQSCPTLCNPIDGSPPGSSVPGIHQARILEWVAISLSNAFMHAKSLQSCPTLCSPMDNSTPGSSIHRILQARVLEYVAIPFSKGMY